MDTVKFIEERNRMCKSFNACENCPAFYAGECEDELCSCAVGYQSTRDTKDQIAIVEAWSAAHPRKTRQSVFLEQWPNASLDRHGVSVLCPKQLNCEFSCIDENDTETPKRCKDCTACRHEFWMQEVE